MFTCAYNVLSGLTMFHHFAGELHFESELRAVGTLRIQEGCGRGVALFLRAHQWQPAKQQGGHHREPQDARADPLHGASKFRPHGEGSVVSPAWMERGRSERVAS